MNYLTHLPKEDPSIAVKSKIGLSFPNPIKYYDFHVYYYANIPSYVTESTAVRNKLLADFPEEAAEGALIVKVLPNDTVIGPHSTQFWEVDVARPEVFLQVLGWFQLNHGRLSVLIHPQTGEDAKDHSERALWLGQQLKVHLEVFDQIEGVGIPEFGVRRGKRVSVDKFDDHKTVIE